MAETDIKLAPIREIRQETDRNDSVSWKWMSDSCKKPFIATGIETREEAQKALFLLVNDDAAGIKSSKFHSKRFAEEREARFTKLTRDLRPRELELYDPRTNNTYKGLFRIDNGFIKSNGQSGTKYIFTSNGVDVNAWRKDSNSDNLEGGLKIEFSCK